MFKIGLIKSLFEGVKDAAMIPALIKRNKDSIPNEGKINWVRMAATIGTIGLSAFLLFQVIAGNITIDEAKDLHKIID